MEEKQSVGAPRDIRRILWRCALAAFAYIAAQTVMGYYGELSAAPYHNSWVSVAAFVAAAALFFHADRHRGRRLHYVALIAASLASITLVAGHSINLHLNLYHLFESPSEAWWHVRMALGIGLFFYFACKWLFSALQKFRVRPLPGREPIFFTDNKRSFAAVAVCIFACWIPCFLAYFPGIFGYDVFHSVRIAVGAGDWHSLLPPLYTQFVRLCLWIGELFGGWEQEQIAVYSLMQMAIMASLYAWAIRRMARMGVHPLLRLAVLLNFALNPMHALFSMISTRDVLFAGFLVVVSVYLWESAADPKGFFASFGKQAVLVALMLAASMFRQNGAYVLFLCLLLCLPLFRRYWRNILAISAVLMAVYHIIVGPLYQALGIPAHGNEVMEPLSLPIQQIVTVVIHHGEEVSPEEQELIEELLDYNGIIRAYNPRFADHAKGLVDIPSYEGMPSRYHGLWASLGLQYPMAYLHAFLNLNLGLWYPDVGQPDPYSERVYLETQMTTRDYFPTERESQWPALQDLYEEFASAAAMRDVPIVSVLFSTGTAIWIAMGGILVCLAQRRKRLIAAFLPSVCLWFSYLFGPVSNLRYIYPLTTCFVIFLAVVLHENPKSPQK